MSDDKCKTCFRMSYEFTKILLIDDRIFNLLKANYKVIVMLIPATKHLNFYDERGSTSNAAEILRIFQNSGTFFHDLCYAFLALNLDHLDYLIGLGKKFAGSRVNIFECTFIEREGYNGKIIESIPLKTLKNGIQRVDPKKENEDLKKEIADLKQENEDLKKEIADLKKKQIENYIPQRKEAVPSAPAICDSNIESLTFDNVYFNNDISFDTTKNVILGNGKITSAIKEHKGTVIFSSNDGCIGFSNIQINGNRVIIGENTTPFILQLWADNDYYEINIE